MKIEGFKQILEEAYGSIGYNFLDLIAILYNIREVVRIEASLNFVEKLKKLLKENNIFYETCLRGETADAMPFDEKNKDRNRDIKLSPEVKEKIKEIKHYMYISKSKEKSRKAMELDIQHTHDNKEIGDMLGYPKCCIEAHGKREVPKGMEVHLAIFHDITKKTNEQGPYSFHNNTLYSKYALIPHFPCKWSCKESTRMGKTYLQALKDYNEEIAKKYEEGLRSDFYLTDKFIVSFNSKKNELEKHNVKFFYGELPEHDKISIKDNNQMEFKKGGIINSFEFKKISFD